MSRDFAQRLTTELRPMQCVCNGFGFSVRGNGHVVACPVHKAWKIKRPRWKGP